MDRGRGKPHSHSPHPFFPPLPAHPHPPFTLPPCLPAKKQAVRGRPPGPNCRQGGWGVGSGNGNAGGVRQPGTGGVKVQVRTTGSEAAGAQDCRGWRNKAPVFGASGRFPTPRSSFRSPESSHVRRSSDGAVRSLNTALYCGRGRATAAGW